MWWHESNTLQRFILDTVMHAVAGLRPGAVLPALSAVTLANAWRDPPLCLDSLELVTAASQLTEALHLHETQMADALLVEPSLSGWIRVATNSLDAWHYSVSFWSSGSSGQPVCTALPMAHLQQEVNQLGELLASEWQRPAAREPATLWSMVPAQHVYGFLFTVLLPACDPGRWQVEDARHRLPVSIARQLRAGDVIVAVPEFWQRWQSLSLTVPEGVTLVTAAGPANEQVVQALCGPGVRVLDVYGATETAGIGYRFSADDPFILFRHWSRDLSGLTSDALTVSLPDVLEWVDERRFWVVSRKDKAVQIAGRNVYPARIAALLNEHDWVEDAVVRPGEQGLKAFVIAADSIEDGRLFESLRNWLSTRLPPEQIPKFFQRGRALPRNAMGKLTDWDFTPTN